jgi:Zn-finger nucleic acid-binding protein
MTCPRCGRQLNGARHETGIAWRCEGCGGQTLNFSQFRRLIPEPQANSIWERVMEKPARPRVRSLCPECRRDMAAVYVPSGGRRLELDICRSCQRVWLDSQEMSAQQLEEARAAAPLLPARHMTGAAQQRLAEQLARRELLRPRVYEMSVRGFILILVLWVIFRLVMKVLSKWGGF